MVIGTAGYLQDLTYLGDRILLCQHLHHHPFLFGCELNIDEAFFAISRCIVSRPTTLSNSAIRSCSWLCMASCSKSRGALSRNSVFQRASSCGLSCCFRHNSAVLLAPLTRSRTTCALNSAVNFRRCAILYPLLADSIHAGFHFASCPIPGGHYTDIAIW